MPTKPLVIVTRKLPDVIETRMMELFDVRLNLDDRPITAARQGWISRLHENLQVRVAQLSGRHVAVVKQPELSDSAEIEAQVLRELPQAKTVISVLSPPFARSEGCRRIVETFWKRASESGMLEVNKYSELDYKDWKLGATYDLNGWVLGAAYVGTDADKAWYYTAGSKGLKENAKSTVVLSVTKTF